jgi:dienelactone hydrolase
LKGIAVRPLHAWPIAAIALSLLASVAAAATLPSTAFSYNAAAPLDIRVVSSRTSGSLVVRDVTFASPERGRIQAEIIAPAGATASRPGVLFVHWLGDAATTNLTEFVPDATVLAQRGAVCVLVDAMWSKPDWFDKGRAPATDYADSIRQVVELRRALDVLVAQPGVDPKRIAYVGHDFGSMYGAVLSGVDTRPQWYVLMAGTTSFSDWYLLGAKPKDKAAYVAQMKPLDPAGYLSKSSARAFYFQFSDHDEFVPVATARAFAAAAAARGEIHFYNAGHDLKGAAIQRDRLAWLEKRLGLSSSPSSP